MTNIIKYQQFKVDRVSFFLNLFGFPILKSTKNNKPTLGFFLMTTLEEISCQKYICLSLNYLLLFFGKLKIDWS